MDFSIREASISDAQLIATLISESNKDVARKFSITHQNNPKHPSFYTPEWVTSDFERGEIYFILELDNTPAGCVALEIPRPETAYLNRLSTIPAVRCCGVGEALVKHHFQQSKDKGVNEVSIGIIAAFEELKQWYFKLGFAEISTREFEHLPFDVCYMSAKI
ncbi:GNAT family N-acetyltransferase [Neptunomonas antarctica]|uniref:N-acetylglutamate synthase, GNAT family n=1 Tax=Neptunomonas antarctica TaxID=619304 RepID=A0A1N7JV82_9GAMM|nr:GNAT family N-acetyltransferase [Neptunomonas antarctica]SIS53243.1 N-acetylglutamate synthase, GNAT family [Neptunomonas antarctica]